MTVSSGGSDDPSPSFMTRTQPASDSVNVSAAHADGHASQEYCSRAGSLPLDALSSMMQDVRGRTLTCVQEPPLRRKLKLSSAPAAT